MDKKAIVVEIIKVLERDLLDLKAAAKATYEAATHEESKPENEYDTRGLEASYLAGAQAKRVGQIEETLYIFKTVQLKAFTEKSVISATALVEVEMDGTKSLVLIMPKGGGISLTVGGQSVHIVTPASPLGEALLGLKMGDVAEFEVGDNTQEYEILRVS